MLDPATVRLGGSIHALSRYAPAWAANLQSVLDKATREGFDDGSYPTQSDCDELVDRLRDCRKCIIGEIHGFEDHYATTEDPEEDCAGCNELGEDLCRELSHALAFPEDFARCSKSVTDVLAAVFNHCQAAHPDLRALA